MRHNNPPETLFKFALIVLAVVLGGILFGMFTAEQMDKAVYVVAGFFVFFILFIRGELILYGLIFSMLLSPEILVGATAKREITVRFEDFLILVMAFSWVVKIAITKDPGLVFYSPFNGRIAIYATLCAVSTTLGMLGEQVDVKSGLMFLMKYLEFYLVYVVVINSIRDRSAIKNYVFAMLATCFVICLVGLVKYFQGVGVAAPFEGDQSIERNTLGGYLVLMFALTLGLLMTLRKTRERIPLMMLLFAVTATLTVSMSRGSWLAVVAVMLFYIAVDKSNRRVLILSLLLGGVLLFYLAPDETRDRLIYTVSQDRPTQEARVQIAGLTLDPSLSARLVSYDRALQELYKHPFLGYGITGFIFIDSQYFRALAEIGILGLLAFLFMIHGIWKTARETLARVKDFEFGLTLGFLGGFAGLLVHSLSTNTFIIVRIMEPFWFLTALVTFMYIEEHHPEVRERYGDNLA